MFVFPSDVLYVIGRDVSLHRDQLLFNGIRRVGKFLKSSESSTLRGSADNSSERIRGVKCLLLWLHDSSIYWLGSTVSVMYRLGPRSSEVLGVRINKKIWPEQLSRTLHHSNEVNNSSQTRVILGNLFIYIYSKNRSVLYLLLTPVICVRTWSRCRRKSVGVTKGSRWEKVESVVSYLDGHSLRSRRGGSEGAP